MKYSLQIVFPIFCGIILSCNKQQENPETPTIISINNNVQVAVQEFKNKLGNPNTTIGAIGGYREINWDGLPNNFILNSIPNNFFNNPISIQSLQRGLIYSGSSGDFRISRDGFKEINGHNAPTDIVAFSGNTVFANITESAWPVNFEVVGTQTEAATKAFGLVFIGVNKEKSSYLEVFNNETSLGKYFALPQTQTSKHSFVGISFTNAVITKVKVTHGDASFTSNFKDISNGGIYDIVAVDDMIYAEPVPKK
jgi:hypothetical protein